MIALRTILWTVVVGGTATVLLPYWVLSHSGGASIWPEGLAQALGAIPVVAGAGLYAWCAWAFTVVGKGTPNPLDAPRELVVTGPYLYVRNPIYVAVLLILLGEAGWFGSIELLSIAAAALVAFHLFVVIYEEPTLARSFGDSYQQYCRTVHRWLPRPRAK
ncbi:MAG: methyltransferase family protein [Sphingomonadales bacterium]